jgi:hypothetical protein
MNTGKAVIYKLKFGQFLNNFHRKQRYVPYNQIITFQVIMLHFKLMELKKYKNFKSIVRPNTSFSLDFFIVFNKKQATKHLFVFDL